ncbi:peroxiredoxin family protein [Chondromyces apiculatus]|uniref:Thioredoxin n=1 Tax=Chondromyces apiculatus DSM 436 TaxID=1192034 RepID=A0A017TAL5_9BACT|nr:TlpA disulfide reductase family protein [Chondromyces apiculatus]EYF05870.1 thioredoxin [Chondromyces apiculatus DSM 436]
MTRDARLGASTRRALTAAVAVLCLSAASCGGAGGSGAGPAAASSGEGEAPDFSLPTLDGKTARLSDYQGQVVLLDFWSTTCDPCLAAMPHLVDMYKKNKERGFVVLSIALDGPESRSQVSSVVHQRGMVFPILLDEETSVTARYNPKRELPFTVLVDRRGAIVRKRGGYQPGDEVTLEAEVEKALAAAP